MVKVIIVLLILVGVATADPAADLRAANAAAVAGDWAKVSALLAPLTQLSPAEQAEAQRLAGLAAFFQDRKDEADAHFHAYLRLDLDGNLDPQLYPPEVITFFIEVRTKYASELRAMRPRQKHYWYLAWIPVVSQIQNGDKITAIVVGSAIGAFAIANLTSYGVLRSWCTQVSGKDGASLTCDDRGDHVSSAKTLSSVNLISGIALIVATAYGVYDGVKGYRRRTHEVQRTHCSEIARTSSELLGRSSAGGCRPWACAHCSLGQGRGVACRLRCIGLFSVEIRASSRLRLSSE